ncbi:MAG: VWA domain-containing protein [Acidobacteriota bacterium]
MAHGLHKRTLMVRHPFQLLSLLLLFAASLGVSIPADAETPSQSTDAKAGQQTGQSDDSEPGDKVDEEKPKKAKGRTKLNKKEAIAALDPKYQLWLESVDQLITKEELRIFLEIEKDYQRDDFIERFWKARDPYPETARNELRETYEQRVEEALTRFGNLSDDRARVYLLNEVPDALIEVRCANLWPIEVWYWQRNKKVGSEFAIMFYQVGAAKWRLWYPSDGVEKILRFPAPDPYEEIQNCSLEGSEAVIAVMNVAARYGAGFVTILADLLLPPERPKGEWVFTYEAYSTEVDESSETFSADLEIEYPGRHQSRTVVQGVLSVPVSEAMQSQLTDYGLTYNFMIIGEVLREDKLFDSFRYQYNLPIANITTEKIPLVFERYLRPGDYSLIIRAEDLNSKAQHRAIKELSVPKMDTLVPSEPSDPETARILAEANAAISSGDTTIKIVPLRGQYQTGMIRVDTLATGKDIDQVVFNVDGRENIIKKSPPWSVELDMGSLPNVRTLTVIAQDSGGRELARDERQLNASPHRFDVQLIEPRRTRRYNRSLRAEARVDVPEGAVVERVEFYLNETLQSTLYQAPWVQPMMLDSSGELAYVRAVAYQPDGNFVEDTVWVNAPDYMENLEIQFVELYITVLDKQGHPVQGLDKENFRVFEDGLPQEVRRFDLVTNLPINAGIVLDVSASMEKNMGIARAAALEFFEQSIEAKDRATLVTFNDHPNLAVKFTNDLPTLASGLAGLKAERGTALYDSVIFALYYFNGIKGQRALILLSDGKDEHSKFAWEETIEYARRAGVSIYSIGLGLSGKLGEAKKKLKKLAEETGGRAFFIDGVDELGSIYRTIQEELRSRYYLAYQSTNTAEDDEFRTVEVELDRSGLEAKTLRGYYP